jgi:serine/threonine protein phosphatase PrpC
MTHWCLLPALATHRGRRRTNNEDAVNYSYPQDAATRHEYGALFVIADGVGGMQRGQHASYLAVNLLLQEYYRAAALTVEGRLQEALLRVNHEVYTQLDGCCATTIVAAVFHEYDMVIAHVGDSRAYWVSSSAIQPLTQDHTMTDPNDKFNTQAKLSRAVGQRAAVAVEVRRYPVARRGSLLMVTDGATRYIDDAALQGIVIHHEPAAAVQTIINRANDAGGADNVSAVVVNVVGDCADESRAAHHIAHLPPVLLTPDAGASSVLVRHATAPVSLTGSSAAGVRKRFTVQTASVAADNVLLQMMLGVLVGLVLFALGYWAYAYWQASLAAQETTPPPAVTAEPHIPAPTPIALEFSRSH